MAAEQVADERFAAHQELVGHHVPGADQDAAVLDRLAQPRFLFRPDLEVVLEHDGLAVEMEMLVVGIGIEQIEQPIDERDEPEPELLVRQIPLAIPVGVGDDVDVQHMCRRLRFVVQVRGSSFDGFYPFTAPAVRPATK